MPGICRIRQLQEETQHKHATEAGAVSRVTHQHSSTALPANAKRSMTTKSPPDTTTKNYSTSRRTSHGATRATSPQGANSDGKNSAASTTTRKQKERRGGTESETAVHDNKELLRHCHDQELLDNEEDITRCHQSHFTTRMPATQRNSAAKTEAATTAESMCVEHLLTSCTQQRGPPRQLHGNCDGQ